MLALPGLLNRNFGLRLFHPPNATLMVLVWHFGGVVLLTVIASGLGRRIHNWRTVLRFS
jgi:hypothetical protein